MRVDYLGLEAFVAIADHGSFQRAAEVLNLSQAALSHRLRKIEEDLDTALLIRSSREMSLTPAGQDLLPEARRLLKALQDAYAAARAGTRGQARRFAFACLPTVANSVLPPILADLHRQRPEIAFEMLDIPVARIVEVVRSGEAEFGLTIVSAEMSDLILRPLIEEDYRLFLRADHRLAGRASVSLEDIEGEPMVRISSQSKNRQLLDIAFGQMRDRMRWQFEVQSATVAIRLVAAGMALTILPETALAMTPPSLVSVPFHGVRLRRTLGVVSRRGAPIAEDAAVLLRHVEAGLSGNFHKHLAVSSDVLSRPRD